MTTSSFERPRQISIARSLPPKLMWPKPYALRAPQALFQAVHVVDHHEAFAELGLKLRNDVHPVLGHVLQRRVADRERRVEGDEIDGGDVVELRVGHAAPAELRRGAGGG